MNVTLRCYDLQVGHLKEASNKAHNAELKLFLEVQRIPGAVSCFHIRTERLVKVFD